MPPTNMAHVLSTCELSCLQPLNRGSVIQTKVVAESAAPNVQGRIQFTDFFSTRILILSIPASLVKKKLANAANRSTWEDQQVCHYEEHEFPCAASFA